ncbi:virulence plasmid A protein [Paenibacillus cellulosilyticus]|uniref:Virulence plasmid A protein n=1 Tax=Paenibacillus cellulosilyticus TaxID=375489 RepID=A0A2V2Z1J6_9BACL|nr:neuraminidase-like domain-containing protein [Paenibacillus cellulosilyticus]PWW01255.1 virulence plasmid A protein [Paenibacillus cellulosilyticus]QKS46796.1 hypothetical protein HUB94_20085 [Paenibacillus cellulosilyticus]
MKTTDALKTADPLIGAFLYANPDFDTRTFVFNDPDAVSGLHWPDGADEATRNRTIDRLKGYQRLLKICPDVESASLLLKGDARMRFDNKDVAASAVLDSAHKIAAISPDHFVRSYAPLLGDGGEQKAKQIHRNALHVRTQAIHQWASLHQVMAPHTQALAVNHFADEIVQATREMPSYDQLFESLSYCNCDECRSILGPAAYFVDLMRIVSQYITKPNEDTVPKGMMLCERRPDLAEIELTCDNTNQTVPYLNIVNAILEATVKGGYAEKADLYKTMAMQAYPFELPFHLPLAQIRIYLKRLNVEWADIYSAFNELDRYWAAAKLDISPEEWNLLVVSDTTEESLQKYFGVTELNTLMNVSTFCAQTGLKLTDLLSLFQQNLSQAELDAGLSAQLFINHGASQPLRIDAEGDGMIIHADNGSWDRIHRFLRLSSKLGWSYAELDWALKCVSGGKGDLNEETLIGLAMLKQFQERYDVSLDIACALVFDLRTYGGGRDSAFADTPFDHIFNGKGLATYHPKDEMDAAHYKLNPLYTTMPALWEPGETTGKHQQLTSWIAGGLGIKPEGLRALAAAIYPNITPIPVTVSVLSGLNRHVVLAAKCKLPLVQYTKFIQLFQFASGTLDTTDVGNLIDKASQLRRSRLNVFELDYIVSGAESPFVAIPYQAQDIAPWMTSLSKLVRSTAADAETRTNELTEQLLVQLARFSGVHTDLMRAIQGLLGLNLVNLFLTSPLAGAREMTTIARLLVLVRKLNLTNDDLNSIRRNPAAYGIDMANGWTPENMLDLFTLMEWKDKSGDASGKINVFMCAENTNDRADVLSDLMASDSSTIGWLLGAFSQENRIVSLTTIQRIVDLIAATGTDLEYLRSLQTMARCQTEPNWDDYQKIAEVTLSFVRAKLAAPTNWDRLFSQIDGEVQEQKRSALVNAAIIQLGKSPDTAWIRNTRDLYEYLLIDVEMSGVAQISSIKEALNAVQLYLLRCRERLESGIVHLDIPVVWWEWMMNYQLWEANRKIFLYPENYIDPAYRKSKTQLFNELENTLKQNEITRDTTEAAFKKYLDRFAELAKLKYVDAYYCNVSDENRDDAPTLFLVARTETKPYKYYYIVRESESTWSEWQEIGISINAETVTPVYAFNKLFLFWIEQKNYNDKQNGQHGNGNSQKVSKIGIRYSFYNFSGKWVQPQSLADDIVYAVDGNAYRASYDTIFPASMFESNQLWWNKVYPLKIESGSYLTPGIGNNPFEKIVLLYGPMLDLEEQPDVGTMIAPTSTDATVLAFESQLHRALAHFTKAKSYGNSGHLPVFDALIINDDLEAGFLTKSDEFVVLERDSTKSQPQLIPNADRGAGRLNLIESNQIILENYLLDQSSGPNPVVLPTRLSPSSFITKDAIVNMDAAFSASIYERLTIGSYVQSNGVPKTDIDFNQLDADLHAFLQGKGQVEARVAFIVESVFRASGTPWISTAIRDKSFNTSTVKNHSNAFVFKEDKEAILLLDTNLSTPPISRALFNADTIFISDDFISRKPSDDFSPKGSPITKEGAEAIYKVLMSTGCLDASGRLVSWANSQSIDEALSGQGNDDQRYSVINILLHTTMFGKSSFQAPPPIDIKPKGSEEIFEQLIQLGNLDMNGRLMANIDFYDLMESLRTLFKEQPNMEQKVRYVADLMYQYPFPTAIGYLDEQNKAADYCKVKYEAIRLTSAAVHRLSRTLFTGGVDALLSLQSQQIPIESELPFQRFQLSESRVIAPEAKDGAQVDFAGAYGQYYWELFFHAPMYIAGLLKTNQQYQDAEKWYQYIFNPTLPKTQLTADSFQTSTLGPRDSSRIFKVLSDKQIITPAGSVCSSFNAQTDLSGFLRFLTESQIDSVRNILLNSMLSTAVARFWQFQPFRNHTLESLKDQLQNAREIAAYNQDPFDPHAIARLRIGAYEKAVLMQYIDNLLKWGDSLFTHYTWESNVAATMHYVHAQNLLGPRPDNRGSCEKPKVEKFSDIYRRYENNIPQFFIELEHSLDTPAVTMTFSPVNALDTYFNVPGNANLISYWDKVEDRLFKIRHSLNINGLPQPMPLFEPQIDPSLLVRAVGTTGDVAAALANGTQSIPYYRFAFMLERARNIAGAATQLGNALLSALEKRDAEALALLHSTHERNILAMTTLLKEKQIEENEAMIDSLQQSLDSAKKRSDHYKTLMDEDMNAMEISDLVLRDLALGLQLTAVATNGITIGGYLTPNIFGLADGGFSVGDAIRAGAEMASGGAAALDQTAGMINTKAGYIRRSEEWELQHKTADYEVKQIQSQLIASQARAEILQRELAIHDKSIKQESDYESFLASKFTNEELYQWMVGRLSTIYFQTYQLAVNTALQAQAAYQYETNRDDTFLGFDYWNGMRRGLLAGENLMLALNQMEKSYVDNHSRYLEIEKTVSLLHLDPVKFIGFKGGVPGATKGLLSFELSEQLFDYDFPGHYCRQIKSISVTIPAVIGPYQNMNAILRQESSATAVSATSKAVAYMLDPSKGVPDDQSVRTNWVPDQQIVLTRGVSDAGLFVLDFRDERYLPFEGTGAVSKWTLSMPPETNRFDFSTLTDILVKIQYTAQDGGRSFRDEVKGLLHADNPPYPYLPTKLFELKAMYPREWNNFISGPTQDGIRQIMFPLTDSIVLPYLKDVSLLSISVILLTPKGKVISDLAAGSPFVLLNVGKGQSIPVPIINNVGTAVLKECCPDSASCRLNVDVKAAPADILADGVLDPLALLGIAVVITYQSNVFGKESRGV